MNNFQKYLPDITDKISEIFAITLQEEKESDLHLSSIAENNVNYAAAQEEEA